MKTILSLLLFLSVTLSMSAAQPVFNPQLPSRTGNGGSMGIQASSDGRFVLFQSAARDLVTNAIPGHGHHLYLADRESNTVQLITVSTNPAFAATGSIDSAAMSDDGRFVVFSSYGTNFVARDSNRLADIFLHDVASRTNRIVNLSSNRMHYLGVYEQPAISKDGSKVAFFSNANLLPQDRNTVRDLYILNTADHKLTLATTPTNILGDMATLHSPQFSDDGRVLLFQGGRTNLIFARELGGTNLHNISSNVVEAATRFGFTGVGHRGSAQPFITAGDTNIYFRAEIVTSSSSANGAYIFRRNLATGRTQLIGRTELGSNDSPYGPVATADSSAAFFVRTGAVQRATEQPATNTVVSRPLLNPFQLGQIAESPRISADGSILTYLSSYTTEAPGEVRIVRQNLTNNQMTVLPFRDVVLSDITPDGRWLLLSIGEPVDSNDINNEYGVVLYDAHEQKSYLVSKSLSVTAQPPGALLFLPGGLSANEQFLAFSSASPHLAPNDTNGLPDVFLYDRLADKITLESRTETNLLNAASGNQLLSPNGDWLAFVSYATNLAADNLNQRDLFLKNLKTGAIHLLAPPNNTTWTLSNYTFNARSTFLLFHVNRGTFLWSLADQSIAQIPRPGAPPLGSPVFSPDGSKLYFASGDAQLGGEPGMLKLFSYDLTNNYTLLGVLNPTNATVTVNEIAPSDRDVALVRMGSRIVKVDRADETVSLVCSDCPNNFVISPDGSWYGLRDTVALNTPIPSDVMRLHLSGADGSPRALPIYTENRVEMDVSHLVMSPDGAHLAFVGRRANAVNYNAAFELFIYSRALHTVTAVLPAFGRTNEPVDYATSAQFSADGKRLYFQSSLPLPGSDERDELGSIFYIDLLAQTGDTDADGLPDQWEVNYFSNLDQTPAGDTDQDGATNLDEFRAGTNPSNDESVLRIYGLNLAQNPDVPLVVYATVPGKRYRVQYKENLAGGWIDLATQTATAATTTAIDNQPKPFGPHQRYYRVILIE